MSYAYAAVMVLIAVVAAFLVLYQGYKETVTQCLSLACIGIGAVTEFKVTLRGIDSQSGLWLLLAGITLFSIATLVRRARQIRRKGP